MFTFNAVFFLHSLQLAGSVTAVFNCQGPLDAPVFVGSGLVSRKIAHSVSEFPASSASEAMVKNKDAGAVAAIDRIPFSYISANFTFNTDNCVSSSSRYILCTFNQYQTFRACYYGDFYCFIHSL